MTDQDSKPTLKPVAILNKDETVTQIMPFNGSLACLTSVGRVLVPGPNFGEWFELPIPPSFSSTG